jgi:hypothetical protein
VSRIVNTFDPRLYDLKSTVEETLSKISELRYTLKLSFARALALVFMAGLAVRLVVILGDFGRRGHGRPLLPRHADHCKSSQRVSTGTAHVASLLSPPFTTLLSGPLVRLSRLRG